MSRMYVHAGSLMIVWFLTTSVVLTWLVFQSPAMDYRMVALGSVLPLIGTISGVGIMHTLAFPTVVLTIVMLATQKRRLVRRAWLGLPIGLYVHLILDMAWAQSETFWWPVYGWDIPTGVTSGVASRGWWNVLLELVGIACAVWAYKKFGFDDPDRRQRFLRTGQLDRNFVQPPTRWK